MNKMTEDLCILTAHKKDVSKKCISKAGLGPTGRQFHQTLFATQKFDGA